jgi:propionyl-CoA carboxylase beta chain
MSINERLDQWRREAVAQAGGGAERQQRQHSEGKLSARKRIDLLLDKDAGIP